METGGVCVRMPLRQPKDLCFRNGYSSDSPSFIARCTVDTGTGKPEWEAEEGKTYYRLHIKEIF